MKTLVFAAVGLLALFARAVSENNTYYFTFKSVPTTYADGKTSVAASTVNAYRLVWVPEAVAAESVAFDMTGNIVRPAGAVKIGDKYRSSKTGGVYFEIDFDAITDYGIASAAVAKKGTFRLFLLDNLKFDANSGAYVGDELQLVGYTASAKATSTDVKVESDPQPEFAVTDLAVKSGDAPLETNPEIVGIDDAGDTLTLTVAGTDSRINYNVAAGDTPTGLSDRSAAEPMTGKASENITITVPKSGTSRFFRVIRHGSK